MAKFEKVTLNGSQKMTAVGWEEVRQENIYYFNKRQPSKV